MAEQRHGRYYARELAIDQAGEIREQVQDVLDEAERREWHLLGVSDLPQGLGVMRFWDTAPPSFARRGAH